MSDPTKETDVAHIVSAITGMGAIDASSITKKLSPEDQSKIIQAYEHEDRDGILAVIYPPDKPSTKETESSAVKPVEKIKPKK